MRHIENLFSQNIYEMIRNIHSDFWFQKAKFRCAKIPTENTLKTKQTEIVISHYLPKYYIFVCFLCSVQLILRRWLHSRRAFSNKIRLISVCEYRIYEVWAISVSIICFHIFSLNSAEKTDFCFSTPIFIQTMSCVT